MARPLTIADVEYLAHRLAKETMNWNEPIPEFETRSPGILESCLAQPFQTFGKKQLYKGLLAQASILFYLLIKNHPFQNGNKRIAVTSMLVFLLKNKRWIHVQNQALYQFAVWVAQSPAELKSHVLPAIQAFLGKYVVKQNDERIS